MSIYFGTTVKATEYYIRWSQPINPSGITATSGWTNPQDAFDGNTTSTYAYCNSLTDYIQWDIGETILLCGVNTTGQQVNGYAVATNFKIYSVDDNGNETLLGTTEGAQNSAPYYTTVSFKPVLVKKLRFYITTTYPNAPSRTNMILLTGYTANGASSSNYKYKIEHKGDIKEVYYGNTKIGQIYKGNQLVYWSSSSWTQPVLTSDGTVGGSSYAVRANSYYTGDGGHEPYKAFNGTIKDVNDCWEEADRTTTGWIEFYSPYALKINSVVITNRITYIVVWNKVKITGSMDGITYFDLGTYDNSVSSYGEKWLIGLSVIRPLKYIRFNTVSIMNGSGGTDETRLNVGDITLIGEKCSSVTEERGEGSEPVAGEVIFESSTAGTYTVNITTSGSYKVYIVGGGGGSYISGAITSMTKRGGGSGAAFVGIMFLAAGTHTVTVGDAGTGGNYMINSTAGESSSIDTLVIAGGGGTGSNNSGGVISVSTDVGKSYIISSEISSNGNSGGYATTSNFVNGGASLYDGWGKGGDSPGGGANYESGVVGYVKIEFVSL